MDNLTFGAVGAVIVIGLLILFKFSGKKKEKRTKMK